MSNNRTCTANVASKQTPVITWANPAPITYGTPLSATQLNATGSVPGTIAYTHASGTTLNAGSHTLSVTFTPNDTTTYNTATVTVTLTVNKATPTITWATPAAVYVGTTLGGQLTATASVPGSFAYTPASGTVLNTVGSQTLSVTFTPDDTTNYNAATASVDITVNSKLTPVITWADPVPITFGTALSATQLNATASVPGNLVFNPASGATLNAGNQTLSVTFTPTDTATYNTATATVTLTVNKATPTITWATPAAVYVGTTLGASQLNATASVPGSFVYTPTSGAVLNTVGGQTLSVTFTPDDTTNYNGATASVNLTVNSKLTPTITWADPAPISYGTALSTTQLNATANVPGTYAYTPASGTTLNAGSHTLSATFSPTDTATYTSATATVTLAVNKATPSITWGVPAAVYVGTALGGTQLNATASVPGSFSYTPEPGAVLNSVGTQTLSVTFTPTDTANYNETTASVNLTVNSKLTPVITWADPAPITFGTALSATQLNATASVPGNLVFTPASGTTLNAGNQILSVTFTPTDTATYNTTTATVTLTVNKATPTITWATPAAVYVGTTLGGQLNATASVPGSFVYTPTSGAVLNTVGSQTLSVTFAPDDTTNYNGATASVNLTVNSKLTPVITWADSAPITYGTALSATQLSATASVPGNFVYTPASGSTLNAGSQTLSVTFTPTDTATYNQATATVTLTVNRATPTITWAAPAAVYVGTALGGTQLNATASVPGSFAYTPASGAVLNTVGTQALSVTFTPTDTINYNGASANVDITVNSKQTPTITWSDPAPITYGMALSATQLNATASVPGSFAYTPASGATLNAGSHTLSVTFTPTDTATYNPATATVTLMVNKVTPAISWAAPAAVYAGTTLGASQLNATASVPGSFVYTPAAGAVLNSVGTQTLSVTFTPGDTTNYNSATASVDLTVNSKLTPAITWSTPEAITYGTALSSAQLNATASVPGTFAYTPAAGAVLSAGSQTLLVTFTPTETGTYNSATATVTLTVNKATPTITWATPVAVYVGTTLGASQLNASASVLGSFAYTPAAGAVLNSVGNQTLSVTFTPTDTTNYNSANTSVDLTVNSKQTPAITWANPAPVTYGTELSATQLNATANVPGTFAYTPAAGAVLSAGSQTLSVIFTPTDTATYNPATGTVTLTVNKATPTVSWAAPAAVYVGTALSGTQLNATASVPGGFAYTPASGAVLNTVGTQALSVTFTPTDTVNYNSATASVDITVNSKLTPTITWSDPAPITYGMALSATQLNATASVPGTFAYTPAAGAVLSAGNQTLLVAFTPTETGTYNPATATVTLTVNKATPTITWATPVAVYVGTTLGASQLNASASVPGSFAYTPAAGAVLNSVGNQTLSVTFTPTDTTNYNSATASVEFTVNSKLTPAITWANLAPVTYGTELSATQLNATANVPGTFAYAPAAGAVLNAGSQTLSVTFTPTDTASYNPATGTVTLTVNKATPTVSWAAPAAVYVGTALGGTQLNATASVPGSFTYTPASGAVMNSVGTQTLSVTFTPTDTINYNGASASVDITVNSKQTPTITWSDPAPITYGTALSATQLNATASVPGSFTYTPASGATLNAGSHTLSVTFTPTDSATYNPATATVTLTVNKATPTITWAAPAPIYVGTALGGTQLSATASVPGSFAYTPATGTILNSVGTQTLSVTFTPTDPTNYNESTASVNLTVNSKQTPAVTWVNPAPVTYGTELSAAQMNATANVPGSFAYTPALGAMLNAGSHTLSVTFTPTDSATYNPATATVTLTVNKATPTITWAAPAAVYVGTTLGASQLNATASVPGSFVYTPAAGAVLNSIGSQTLSVTFTPGDTTNYNSATASADLTVNSKLAPAITWANPAPITYGTELSATQLNATANVPGTFAYTPAAGAVLNAGSQTLSVTFTPTDTATYNTATATATLTVNKATPTIAWAAPAAVYVGTTLGASQLNATASVPGSFAYTPAAGVVLTSVGTQTLSVTFTPTDTTNYNSATGSVDLTVNSKLTPAITWATLEAITYGTALSSAQLNATASVPGSFAYSPAAGAVLNAGSQTLSVTFTPTDTATYNTAAATVTLTVNKATPIITWATPTAVYVGTTLGASQLNATASVPGSFVYTPAAGAVLNSVGTQTLSVAFAPTDTSNYNDASASVDLTVNSKLTPAIIWANPEAITYGTALSATHLNTTASVPGTFAFTPALGAMLNAGSQTLSVTFTPTDTATYNPATATVTLTVNKATPTITWATPAAVYVGTTLGASQLNSSASVPGSFAYTPAAGAVLNSVGTQTLSVTFTPSDSTNYNSATGSVDLTVNSKLTPVITWPTLEAITYGTELSAAQMNATANVPGTFAFTPALGAMLNAGSQTLSVTFTPTDTATYNPATATVTLTVNKATPTIIWAAPAAVYVGTSLDASQLNATASVPGSFAYTPAAGAALNSIGTQTLSVTFMPSDTTNYNSAMASVDLTVNSKLTPAITWSTPDAITYGTALSSAQLNATASVPGSFANTPALGTILNAGSHTLTVTFTPTDTATYDTATATMELTVHQAASTIFWTAPATIYTGTALSASQLNATANEPGTFVYSPDSGTVLPAGVHALSVTFTPNDSVNFTTVTTTVDLTVEDGDVTEPDLVVSALADGSITNANPLNIGVTCTDASGVESITVNGNEVVGSTYSNTLQVGDNVITTVCTDNGMPVNNSRTDVRTITYDPNAPLLTITAPADNSRTNKTSVTVAGSVNETSDVTISVNNWPVQYASKLNGQYTAEVMLDLNATNTITVTATDIVGNTSSQKRTVTQDSLGPDLAVTDPAQDIETTIDSYLLKGTVADALSSSVTVTITVDGASYTPAVVNGAFEQSIPLVTAKTYQITVTATDDLGNVSSSIQRNIIKKPVWRNVTTQTTVTKSVPVYDRINSVYYVLVKLTNTGSSPLAGPLRLVVTNPSPAQKSALAGLNPDGITPDGYQYYTVVPDGGSLAAGAFLSNLRLNFLVKLPITFGTRIEQLQ